MQDDNKFVVFNRQRLLAVMPMDDQKLYMPLQVDDAVVIRQQDIFAGPALHVYSASINAAIMAIKDRDPKADCRKLQSIADYFHEQATEADQLAGSEAGKIPD